MTEYALALGAIFAVNLLPAFGPPTWSVLVFLTLTFDLEAVVLVPTGAVAAASGRLVLATATRRFRSRFPPERIENLAQLESELTRSRSRAGAGLGLFALSPLPSGQLFVAAGLLTVPLLPLTSRLLRGSPGLLFDLRRGHICCWRKPWRPGRRGPGLAAWDRASGSDARWARCDGSGGLDPDPY